MLELVSKMICLDMLPPHRFATVSTTEISLRTRTLLPPKVHTSSPRCKF